VDLGTSSNRSSPSRAPRHYRQRAWTRSCCCRRRKGGSRAQSYGRVQHARSGVRQRGRRPIKNRDANDQSPSCAGSSCLERGVRESTRVPPRGLCVPLSSAAMACLAYARVRQRTDLTIGHTSTCQIPTPVQRDYGGPAGNRSLPIALSQRGEVVRFSHETSVFPAVPCSRRVLAVPLETA